MQLHNIKTCQVKCLFNVQWIINIKAMFVDIKHSKSRLIIRLFWTMSVSFDHLFWLSKVNIWVVTKCSILVHVMHVQIYLAYNLHIPVTFTYLHSYMYFYLILAVNICIWKGLDCFWISTKKVHCCIINTIWRGILESPCPSVSLTVRLSVCLRVWVCCDIVSHRD